MTREQVVTDRLSFFARMDKDEKNMAERIAKLKVELADSRHLPLLPLREL